MFVFSRDKEGQTKIMQTLPPDRRFHVPAVRTLRLAGVLAVPVLALAVAACGSNSTPTVTGAAPAPAATPSAAGAPGTVGMIAAINGNSLQVQNPSSGQVAVDFNGSTRITQQQSAALSAVKAGDCLTGAGTPATGGTGVTARTVTISTPVGGSCTAERGGPGGGFGGGGRGNRSAAPRPSASARDTATVSGTVTAVSGSVITVSGTLRSGGGPRSSTPPAARSLRVAVDSATRFTDTVVVSSSALKTGECVAAAGKSNDIGAIQATAISIFQAGQNGCAFGRGPGAGGSPGAGGANG